MMAKRYGASSTPKNLPTWLREMLDGGCYPGLVWDEDKKDHFKLPWVSEGEPGWEMCYRLFHNWSERDGKKPVDHPTAKQRFRTALNKSYHVEKIHKEEKQTGTYYLCKFLSPLEVTESKKSRKVKSPSNPFTPEEYRNSPNRDDGQLKTIGEKSCDILMTDTQMPMADSFHMNESQNNFSQYSSPPCDRVDVNEDFDLHFDPLISQYGISKATNMSTRMSGTTSDDYNEISRSCLNAVDVTETDKKSCDVIVYYDGVAVDKMLVRNLDHGFHILHAKVREDVDKVHQLFVEKYGLKHSGEILNLPEPESANENLELILNCMDVGVYVWYDHGTQCIKMTRLCQSQVYYIDVHQENYTTQSPVKIEQKEEKVLFSYDLFLSSHNHLFDQASGGSSTHDKMPADFFITIGARPNPISSGEYKKGVKISFHPHAAKKFLQKSQNPGIPCISVVANSLEHEIRKLKLNN